MRVSVTAFLCLAVIAFVAANQRKGCTERGGECRLVKRSDDTCPGGVRKLDCTARKRCCLPEGAVKSIKGKDGKDAKKITASKKRPEVKGRSERKGERDEGDNGNPLSKSPNKKKSRKNKGKSRQPKGSNGRKGSRGGKTPGKERQKKLDKGGSGKGRRRKLNGNREKPAKKDKARRAKRPKKGKKAGQKDKGGKVNKLGQNDKEGKGSRPNQNDKGETRKTILGKKVRKDGRVGKSGKDSKTLDGGNPNKRIQANKQNRKEKPGKKKSAKENGPRKDGVSTRQKCRAKKQCKQLKGKCNAASKKCKGEAFSGKKYCSGSCSCCVKKKQLCKEKSKCKKKKGTCQFKWDPCDGQKIKKSCKGSKTCVCCAPKSCTDKKRQCKNGGGSCVLKDEDCAGEVDSSLCGKFCKCCINTDGSTTPPIISTPSIANSGSGGGFEDAGFGEVSGPCLIECPSKPSDENCTEYFDGCCTRYICGDLPRNCQDGGVVYELGQSYEPDKCYICYCSYSEQGAVENCYTNSYCPGPPHKDCEQLGKPQDKCCEEYNCSMTTCKLDGSYYGINEEWVAKRDPCKNCTCIKTGSEPPQTVCVEVSCPAPPSPACRPLKYVDECCPHDWDCTNDYLITTARKYVRGHKVPLCVFDNSQGSPVDLTFQLSDKSETTSSVKVQQTLSSGYSCAELDIPNTLAESAVLNITGTVGQTKVQQEHQILTVGIHQTFVQTDKYLYLPGQLVQFRILTLIGSQGSVSYEPIESVWIQSPSGNRLTQWTDVPNPDGLLQLSFQLAEEVEEGDYKIKVNTSRLQELTTQTFKAESYVLPRFTVTLDVPSSVLATATEIPFTVCGKYTYGKPVKGEVTFNVTLSRYYGDSESVPLSKKDVNGCWEGKADLTSLKSDFYVSYLKTTATFVEEGTQVEANATKSIYIVYNIYSYEILSGVEYFRHGLPLPFKLKVTRNDGEPIAGKVMSLCAGSICKDSTLDGTGIIDALLPSSLLKDNKEIVVKPTDPGRETGPLGSLYTSNYYNYLESYYSPSKSGLQLEMPSQVLSCSSISTEVDIPVFFVSNGTTRALIRAQLVSRDQVLWTQAQEYDLTASALPIDQSKLIQPEDDIDPGLVRGSFVIKVPTTSSNSPDLKVLVWYARTDGEVVSASGELKSEQCLNNPTSLTFSSSMPTPAPKDPVTLTLSASPKSVCGIGVVDRSVEILSQSQSDRLTNSAIFGVLNKARISRYENTQINTQEYCYGSNDYNYFGFYDGDLAVAASRAERSIFYPYWYSSDVDAIQAFSDAGLLVLTDLTVETRPCRSNSYNYYDDYFYAALVPTSAAATGPPPPGEAGGSDTSPDVTGSEDADGAESRDYFPETWLWQMVVVGDEGQNVEGLQLPDTITEWVGEAVCTHPEKGLGLSPYATITTFTPFFLDLTLPPSARRGESIPVLVSVFNYQNETLPVTVTLQESSNYTATTTSAEVCVSTDDKGVAEFIVSPSVVGDVNLTFTASVNKLNTQCSSTTTIEKSDTIIKPLRVKFEGVIEEKVVSDYFCLENGQPQVAPEPWSISTPEGIVPDSERIFVSVTKDIMGPTLENLGNLIRMPYGCGEQNMLTFTPNIYVLQYLEAIGQSTPTAEQNAKTYMEAGYQRELTYRRDDGSYSAFGEGDAEGSTFLTAFVLRSFAQAARFITIDEDELKLSTSWLLGLQDKDGCFALKGSVHNKDLLGGVDGKSLVPLTAYILISMLESGRVNDTSPVTNAISCITSSSKTDPYTNSLIGYALALASDTRAKNLIDTTYSALTTNPDAINQPTLVETAGYTLLAMMKIDQNAYVAEASKMAKLISSNRNGQGGFVSTQDTVIGLQSLATFSEKYPSPTGTMNLGVSAGNETLAFTLNDENRLLMNTQDVTQNPPFNVSRTATGEGCALVMLVQRYNVPELKESTAFSLPVTPTKLSCTSYNMEVCASYLLQDGSSNMAVIEVDLETGFSAVQNDLQSLVDQNKIKRHEDDDGVISLYLDAVTSSQTCLVFGMTTETKVENASPGTVSVYDYYEPKEKVTQKYVSDRQGC